MAKNEYIFVCDATFVILFTKELGSAGRSLIEDLVKNPKKAKFRFYVTPAVVREALGRQANELHSFINTGLFIESPISDHYALYGSVLSSISTVLGHGETETLMKTVELQKNNKRKARIYAIVDEKPAINNWQLFRVRRKQRLSKLCKSVEFIIKLRKWREIDGARALDLIKKIERIHKSRNKENRFWIRTEDIKRAKQAIK